MSVLPITRFPDPLLKKPAHRVTRINGEVLRFIGRMIATMNHHPRCVGLAAPQVGSLLRIAVMDSSRNPRVQQSRGLIVLINPVLEEAEGGLIQREGCLSVPDFTGNLRRATKVRICAQDSEGGLFNCWLEGFEAVIAQHEIDHLDGKLFLDRVTNLATDLFRRKNYA